MPRSEGEESTATTGADYYAMTKEQVVEKLKKKKTETNRKDKRLRGVVAKLREEVAEKDKKIKELEEGGGRKRIKEERVIERV